MNIQIYVDKANQQLSSISQDIKREIFVKGLLKKIKTADDLKMFIMENKTFDIVNVDGNVVTNREGFTREANFEVLVDDTYEPRDFGDIYCAVSCLKNIFYRGQVIRIFPLYFLDKIPNWFIAFQRELKDNERESQNRDIVINNVRKDDCDIDDVKKNVTQLLDLFLRGKRGLGSHLTDDDINAVEFLQNFIIGDENE